MKRVCVVGYGVIGSVHAKLVQETENAAIYAVCDIDAEKLEKCQQTYNVITYDDFDEMLKDELIDSVHICTPHYLHFEMIKKALEAGKEVVTEKPVTMTKEEFYELRNLKNVHKVAVVFQNRLNPCVKKMKSVVESGEFGKIKTARGLLTWNREKSYYENSEWRGKRDTEGGGVLINQAIHTLDYFTYLIGPVQKVQASMSNFSLSGITEVEDTLSACLEFSDGVRAVFFATNAYKEDALPFFEIVFEKGTARYMDKKLWINGELVEEDWVVSTEKAYWGGGHKELIKNYYDEGEYFSVEDAANTMEAVFAIYDVARF